MEIGLISCTKSKRDSSASPRNLYDSSALFRKARRYAEEHHDRWYILSARHHLLNPDGQEISPYDESLTSAPISERRRWARKVHDQLTGEGVLLEDTTLVIHAGRAYYEELLPLFEEDGVNICIPTEGLMLGEKLAWYNEHLESANNS